MIRIPIRNYEGYYEMDLLGNLYSIDRYITNSLGRTSFIPGIKIKPINHNTGYYVVRLTKKNKGKTFRLHRLIAETLIPNPENKEFVNHINGDKKDNRIENLEWCTAQENSIHAVRLGLLVNNRCSYTGRFLKNSQLI